MFKLLSGFSKNLLVNNVKVVGYNRVKLNDWPSHVTCLFAKKHMVTKDVIGSTVGPSLDLLVAELIRLVLTRHKYD